MDWDQLVAEFCALGGIVENVRLADGPRGRGLFVVDPSKPARVHASMNLLVPVDDIEIRDGEMRIKAGAAVGDRERDFFERYERHYGWGAGLFDELWQTQKAWSELPPAVIGAVKNMGALADPNQPFLAPTTDVCSTTYVRTRCFDRRGTSYVMPVVELVNHCSNGTAYVVEDGLGVKGTFDGEMLVRYSVDDDFGRVLMSGFSDPSVFAYSLAITVNIDGGQQVSIGRDISAFDLLAGIRFPRAQRQGNVLQLPFLTLGITTAPDLPRAIFRKLMSGNLTAARADDVFDNIAHFNHTKFLDLLLTLRDHRGPIVRVLEDAAINQLKALSCAIGARSLDDLLSS